MLFRLAEPTGSVRVDGIQTTDIGLHDLRSKISIIPQASAKVVGSYTVYYRCTDGLEGERVNTLKVQAVYYGCIGDFECERVNTLKVQAVYYGCIGDFECERVNTGEGQRI